MAEANNNSSALVPVHPERQQLQETARQALAGLSDRERKYVESILAGAEPSAAVVEAGYAESAKSTGRQVAILRARPRVVEAIAAGLAARDASATITHERMCALLETALLTKLSDLGEVHPNGTLTWLRPVETLTPGQLLRVRRMSAKVHKSAKGEQAGYRWIEIDFEPPSKLIAQLGELRGFKPESPQYQALLALATAATRASVSRPAFDVTLDSLADAVLDEHQLPAYLEAKDAGQLDACAELLRSAINRLRRLRESVDVEVLPAEASSG
jgi:hypothetical protein